MSIVIGLFIVWQESPANAKVSARQPWYIGHNSLNHSSLAFFTVTPQHKHQFTGKCEVAQNSEKIWTYSTSRSSKAIELGASRKRISLCNFLLVISSNFGRISYRIRDIDAQSSKITCFPPPHPCFTQGEPVRISGLNSATRHPIDFVFVLGWGFREGGSNGAISGWIKFKMAASGHLEKLQVAKFLKSIIRFTVWVRGRHS